jgi:hypothetical protein
MGAQAGCLSEVANKINNKCDGSRCISMWNSG